MDSRKQLVGMRPRNDGKTCFHHESSTNAPLMNAPLTKHRKHGQRAHCLRLAALYGLRGAWMMQALVSSARHGDDASGLIPIL